MLYINITRPSNGQRSSNFLVRHLHNRKDKGRINTNNNTLGSAARQTQRNAFYQSEDVGSRWFALKHLIGFIGQLPFIFHRNVDDFGDA